MLRRLGGLVFAALLLGANPATAQTSSVGIVAESLPSGDVAATPVKPLEISDIDYPFDAMLANEEGEVTVALAIDSLGRVQNSRLAGLSRYQRLNEQSLRLARQRWQFQPATRNGMPVDGTVRVRFTWRLPLEAVTEFPVTSAGESEPTDRASFRCYQQPMEFSEREGTDTAKNSSPAAKRYERWTHVDGKGVATDTLLATSKGLMRVSKPVLEAMMHGNYPRPTGTGCWYYDPIYTQR